MNTNMFEASKVIRQHMFFFILSYFLDNNLWIKKDTIGLVHKKNQDKMPKFDMSDIFAVCRHWQIFLLFELSYIAYNVFYRIWKLKNVLFE